VGSVAAGTVLVEMVAGGAGSRLAVGVTGAGADVQALQSITNHTLNRIKRCFMTISSSRTHFRSNPLH
jgi:hypothetical protein